MAQRLPRLHGMQGRLAGAPTPNVDIVTLAAYLIGATALGWSVARLTPGAPEGTDPEYWRRRVVHYDGYDGPVRGPCGEFAPYVSVKKGHVRPRCERHAKSDAMRWGVKINEDVAIEFRGVFLEGVKLSRRSP